MSNNLRENGATQTASQENTSANEGRKTSLPCMTREEGRAMMAEYEEAANRVMEYMEENNLFPKFRLPARNREEKSHETID